MYEDPNIEDPNIEELDKGNERFVTKLDKDYIYSLLKFNKLEKAEIKRDLRNFADEIGLSNGIIEGIIEEYDENRIKNIIFCDWINNYLAEIEDDIRLLTPWSLEEGKESSLFNRIIGPIREKLPVVVTVENDKRYIHDCSEGLVLGILLVVTGYDINLYLADVDTGEIASRSIDRSDIEPNYTNQKSSMYTAISPITGQKYYFDEIDFIQGIITGAMWLNKSPHNYITNITREGLPVTF